MRGRAGGWAGPGMEHHLSFQDVTQRSGAQRGAQRGAHLPTSGPALEWTGARHQPPPQLLPGHLEESCSRAKGEAESDEDGEGDRKRQRWQRWALGGRD